MRKVLVGLVLVGCGDSFAGRESYAVVGTGGGAGASGTAAAGAEGVAGALVAGTAGAPAEDAGSEGGEPPDAACSGRHLRFPGTAGSHASFPSFASLSPPLTVEFWVRTSAGEQVDVAHVGPESPCGWGIRVRGDEVHAGITAAFDHFAQPPPSTAWRHVAWTYDGDRSSLYVDGTRVGTKDATSPFGIPHCSGPMTIGAVLDGGGTPYAWGTGRLDEVRVTGRVRYEADFTPARRLERSDSAGLWHLDEPDGTALLDECGAAPGVILGVVSRECDQ